MGQTVIVDPDLELVKFVYKNHSYRFSGYTGDHITEVMKRTGTFYEEDLLREIASHRREGLYIDVGGFIGTHAAFFRTQCPSSAVIYVEPNPVSFDIGQSNLVGAGKPVRCVNKAVHDVLASGTLWKPHGANHGMYRFSMNYGEDADGLVFDNKTSITLGELVVTSPFAAQPVAVIKIDVEGNECPVLRSGSELIRQYKPIIAIETQTPEAREKVEAILFPWGYEHWGTYCATPTQIYL